MSILWRSRDSFSLFNVLENVFRRFGETSKTAFILGVGYKKSDASKWQLLNLIVGETKLSIYSSGKNRVEDRTGQEALPIFISLVKARVWVDFRFFKGMSNMDDFVEKWCYEDTICSVAGDDLIFNIIRCY